MTATATTALDVLLDDLREAAWRGDGEAQKNYINLGARREATAMDTLREVDRMIAAAIWQTTGATK
jgi:hypothetical protein